MRCFIGAGLDLAQLGILAAKKCWVLHIDALIIGADGSLADATSLAVKVRPIILRCSLWTTGRRTPAMVALCAVVHVPDACSQPLRCNLLLAQFTARPADRRAVPSM
jgi:hypothetical protein